MIKVNQLSFHYAGQRHSVFEDFDLELPHAGIYGLLGKNGTGKSTLLYLMSGLLRAKRGIIEVGGLRPAERPVELLRDMLIVPEEFELPNMRLSRYVKLNSVFYPRFSAEVLNQCLHDFELEPDIKLGQLSMGQKKKAYISFALATQTRYLLMDEPTNGLDIPSKSQFRKAVATHTAEGATVVISTHQVRDVDQLLDHVVMIDQRRMLLNLSMEEICARYRFELLRTDEMDETVLYAEPSLQGNNVIAVNTDGRETRPNVELLFNAVSSGAIHG